MKFFEKFTAIQTTEREKVQTISNKLHLTTSMRTRKILFGFNARKKLT